jgi:hypothetical protein
MAIVINEFEALAEAPEPRRRSGADTEAEGGKAPPLPEPQDLEPVLRALREQALRSWAH